jgi:hypothetical protein
VQFTQFLKNCEKQGLKNQQIINSMKKFTTLGIERMNKYRFNKLINLVDSMLIRDLKIEDLYNIYSLKNELYQRGYYLCADLARDIVVEEICKQGKIDLIEATSISLNVKMRLVTNPLSQAPPT